MFRIRHIKHIDCKIKHRVKDGRETDIEEKFLIDLLFLSRHVMWKVPFLFFLRLLIRFGLEKDAARADRTFVNFSDSNNILSMTILLGHQMPFVCVWWTLHPTMQKINLSDLSISVVGKSKTIQLFFTDEIKPSTSSILIFFWSRFFLLG